MFIFMFHNVRKEIVYSFNLNLIFRLDFSLRRLLYKTKFKKTRSIAFPINLNAQLLSLLQNPSLNFFFQINY